MNKREAAKIASALVRRGFSQSTGIKIDRGWRVHVSCGSCEALVINGVACHEPGCRNRTRACRGCGEPVKGDNHYCDDCNQR